MLLPASALLEMALAAIYMLLEESYEVPCLLRDITLGAPLQVPLLASSAAPVLECSIDAGKGCAAISSSGRPLLQGSTAALQVHNVSSFCF